MVNIFHIYDRVVRWVMKAAGVRPVQVQIKPGTTMNFWVPAGNPNKIHQNHPPLLLLHGFAANAIMTWQFQVLNLAKKYAVYVPDFIFFGESVTDRPDRSPEFQAECVAEGLRKLGVERGCVLVGFSYGAMVGFRMAEMYPELVEAMVVTAAPTVLMESISRESLEKIGFKSWSEYLIPESAEGVKSLLEIASFKFPRVPRWIFKHYLEAMVMHKKERAELLRELVAADDVIISQYPQKLHVIWGRNDNLFDVQIAYNMIEEFGGKARLDCIEKAGHIVPLERPFIYNKCLQNFLHSLLEGKP
ncbi:epoxide hydrolase 4-like [Benincasa hispida]|uniref:epoxide hydrolase 4-like n=1 Tax=Benincasa hispida TaxID=102211 RepID=UPI001900C17B|nr:epoxide hydrolase 4-like [Benincasa hispida]